MTKSSKEKLTQAELMAEVVYDKETGSFTRAGSTTPIGTVNAGGYVVFRVLGRLYYAQRLAWLYVTGDWPIKADHRDGVRSNNRWLNLRNLDSRGNAENNHTATGVHFHKPSGRIKSAIEINGVPKHLGYFDTAEEANAAYLQAKRIHHSNWVGAASA